MRHSTCLSKHGVEPARDARYLGHGFQVNLMEEIVERVNVVDVLVFEDLIKLFPLGIRGVLVSGYRYFTGIDGSSPYFEIHTSLKDRFFSHEVT